MANNCKIIDCALIALIAGVILFSISAISYNIGFKKGVVDGGGYMIELLKSAQEQSENSIDKSFDVTYIKDGKLDTLKIKFK